MFLGEKGERRIGSEKLQKEKFLSGLPAILTFREVIKGFSSNGGSWERREINTREVNQAGASSQSFCASSARALLWLHLCSWGLHKHPGSFCCSVRRKSESAGGRLVLHSLFPRGWPCSDPLPEGDLQAQAPVPVTAPSQGCHRAWSLPNP